MDKVIRKGVSRQDLIGILLRSERPEEVHLAEEYIGHLDQLPNYDADAIGLFIDGKAMAAGGLRQVGPALGMLWIVSCVDLGQYRFPLMRHAHALARQAKTNGWKLVSVVPAAIDRAKNPSEHLGLTPHHLTARGHVLYV